MHDESSHTPPELRQAPDAALKMIATVAVVAIVLMIWLVGCGGSGATASSPRAAPISTAKPALPASGGLGLQKAEWEALYGRYVSVNSAVNSYAYEGTPAGRVSMGTTDSTEERTTRVSSLSRSFDPPVTLEEAQRILEPLAPRDAQLVRGYVYKITAGREQNFVEEFSSELLAQRLANVKGFFMDGRNSFWIGGKPGDYVIRYYTVDNVWPREDRLVRSALMQLGRSVRL